MPTFKYVAKKGPQDMVEGVLEAESRAMVLAHLSNLGYVPVKIRESASAEKPAPAAVAVTTSGRVPVRACNHFTRQFASLIRAQVPLLRALDILREQTANPRLARILASITDDVRQGETLSEAMGKHPRVFSPLYVSLTRAGEVAGTLDAVFDRLAAQADREEAMRAKMQSAMIYPAFVGLVGCGTVIFLLTFVMPKLVKLFSGFGGRLPMPTRILLAVSAWCQQIWFWAALAAVVGAAVAVLRSRWVARRMILDRVSLRVPLLGALIQQLELARFARSFGLVLDHGISILQAVDVALPVVRNRVIRAELERLPASLREGGSLADCLKGLRVSTPFLVHAVAVGEEGGRVGEALMEVANFYEREVDRLLQTLSSLLEPAMILMVGGVVGFIVMAVLLPIFEMNVIAR